MFGYITPALAVLDENQRARYRTAYCGLCHSLSRQSGQAGRLTLSHDMTFLSILLSSLYEPDSCVRTSRCALHPLKAQSWETSGMSDYAAAMNLLLFWYKCEDECRDGHSVSGRQALRLLRKPVQRVMEQFPRQADTIGSALRELWQYEKESSPPADTMCNLSGEMLGAAFVPNPEDHWASGLYRIGEALGRFVYWMDAWDDYEEDRRRGRFNPLHAYRSRADYEEFCRDTLELFVSEAVAHFEMLPLERDLDILRNVLYSGVWQRYNLRMNQRGRRNQTHAE